MSGAKRAVITGASSGIGLEIARGLQGQGFETILAVRSVERGEAAARAIASSTGGAPPEVMEVDFASGESIHAFARALAKRHAVLDVLVNNAGIWSSSRRETSDGIERVWATNQLGYFLTTELLKPLLLQAPRARVVSVASELARDLDLTDVSFRRRRYTGVASYAQSKQANRMWTRALARRFLGTNVTINSLHPGGVATGIFGKGGGLLGTLVGGVAKVLGKTPKEGADTAVWLATSSEVEGRTGLFYVDREERRCRFTNELEEEKLFTLCATMTGVTSDPS
ncbi:MAG: SDR family NAD(P)-dependent oxidoreductase [Vicinamibacteria bacterium]